MVERGVPLNIGFKGAEASDMQQKVFICDDEGGPSEYAAPSLQTTESAATNSTHPGERVARVDARTSRKKHQQPRSGAGAFKGKCYICGGGHLMTSCPQKRCPRCGEKGHNLYDCTATKVSPEPVVGAVNQANDSSRPSRDCAVLLPVKLDGHDSVALIDSGAGPSVIDKGSLLKLKLLRTIKRAKNSHVQGVGNAHAPIFGHANLSVTLADGRAVPCEFTVLDTYDETILLGRSFLCKFSSLEFDWDGRRIRLGDSWYDASIMLSGGEVDGRVDVARIEQHTHVNNNQEFDINPELTDDQKQKLSNLLSKYKSVWATNPKKPALCKLGKHKIDTGGAKPVKQKMRRMSPNNSAEVNRQIEEMLANGICRPSDSPWSSGVILVRKRDGTQRFVVDYRQLNTATEKDAYPLPNAKDLFDRMHGSRIFSFMDCASAYWSVELDESDRYKTAFSIPRGQYEMNVMAFGLCNSQSTYQRVIDSVLKGVERAAAYIDDVCCFSVSFEQHLADLEQTLKRLQSANMQLRSEKCRFGYASGAFLGHDVSAKGCSPLPENIKAIQNCARPTSKKELQRFLGMLNYYRSLIPRMAEVASPLYALTGANVAWAWSEECEKSFSTLRDILTSDMVLAFPQWDKPFFVEVDGSGSGVGAMLSQEDDTGKLRPLAYYSSGLTATQRNYSASKIECWALISATRKWDVYVSAAPEVILISDHNPLTWLRRQRDPRRKFARWIAELECLNYTVVYRKGVNHAAPDFLSRIESEVDRGVNDDEEHFERHIYAVGESNIISEIRQVRGTTRA